MEITLDYDKYQEMEKTIEGYREAVEKLEKEHDIVIVKTFSFERIGNLFLVSDKPKTVEHIGKDDALKKVVDMVEAKSNESADLKAKELIYEQAYRGSLRDIVELKSRNLWQRILNR